uniref:Uncharacterized protein n=1 Tax=Anguilla anguilla TaxID=7936 RepID=A0A0E9TXS1_ANGAN
MVHINFHMDCVCESVTLPKTVEVVESVRYFKWDVDALNKNHRAVDYH